MPDFVTRRRTLLFVLLFALSLAQLAAGLAVAWQVGFLFQLLDTGKAIGWEAIGVLLALALPVFLTELGRRRTTEALGLDFARSVRLSLFSHMLRRPIGRRRRERSRGGQLLPFVGDLSALRLWWSDGIARGSSAALIAIGVCVWLVLIEWQLGVTVAALFCASLAAMVLSLRPFAKAARLQRQRRGGLVALISDRLAAPGAVRALGGLRRELNLAGKRNRKMDEASLQRAGWSGLMRGLSACFSVLSLAALLALAGKGSIPLHRVIEVMAMTGLLAGALADLVRALELAVPARIAHAKIAARFAEGAQPAEGQDVKRNPSSKTVLELCEFRIETDAEPFDCTVRRGDRIALECGPESSASSVFAMIAGLSLPASGGVFHCGRPALSLSQARRRNRIGIAAPWLPLLRTKARGNASYRLRGWAELPMQHLAKRLQLTEVLVRNPLVDPASSAVSAHELAGLCVLRAVAGQPDLLLLDEADQHLLPEQVSALAEIIASWPGAVIFTCRSAALREQANRTWHLASGTLKEAQPGIGPRLAFSTMR